MATTKKKPTAKSNTKKAAANRSFVVASERPPFFAFRITHQTFYWVVLGALILALGVWVLTLTVKIQQIYDDIDILQSQNSDAPAKKQ